MRRSPGNRCSSLRSPRYRTKADTDRAGSTPLPFPSSRQAFGPRTIQAVAAFESASGREYRCRNDPRIQVSRTPELNAPVGRSVPAGQPRPPRHGGAPRRMDRGMTDRGVGQLSTCGPLPLAPGEQSKGSMRRMRTQPSPPGLRDDPAPTDPTSSSGPSIMPFGSALPAAQPTNRCSGPPMAVRARSRLRESPAREGPGSTRARLASGEHRIACRTPARAPGIS